LPSTKIQRITSKVDIVGMWPNSISLLNGQVVLQAFNYKVEFQYIPILCNCNKYKDIFKVDFIHAIIQKIYHFNRCRECGTSRRLQNTLTISKSPTWDNFIFYNLF